MAGNELVPLIETQAIGIGFQRQGVAGVLRGDGIAVGLDGNAKLPGGADLGHGGDIERMQRHGTQRRPLGVPQHGWLLAGFAVQRAHWPRYRASAGRRD